MNAYYLLGRLFSPIVGMVFYLYSLLTKTQRSRIVVRSELGEVLLLQAWPNTDTWSLPGGGLKRGERPEEAGVRELHEETGLVVPAESMQPCFSYRSHGHQELVFTVVASRTDLPAVPPNRWEVRRMEWFSLNALPKVSPEVRMVMTKVAAKD